MLSIRLAFVWVRIGADKPLFQKCCKLEKLLQKNTTPTFYCWLVTMCFSSTAVTWSCHHTRRGVVSQNALGCHPQRHFSRGRQQWRLYVLCYVVSALSCSASELSMVACYAVVACILCVYMSYSLVLYICTLCLTLRLPYWYLSYYRYTR